MLYLNARTVVYIIIVLVNNEIVKSQSPQSQSQSSLCVSSKYKITKNDDNDRKKDVVDLNLRLLFKLVKWNLLIIIISHLFQSSYGKCLLLNRNRNRNKAIHKIALTNTLESDASVSIEFHLTARFASFNKITFKMLVYIVKRVLMKIFVIY